MKKIKLGKGITLIVLIITIVVLLIIAVVTIGSINNSNIITYAQNAVADYNDKKDEEESIISGYESLIESKIPGKGDTDKDQNSVIVNSTANSIPNGTYYAFGEDTMTYITISDSGNVFRFLDTDFEPVITIENGVVTVTVTVGENNIVFDGNYYETVNGNKIITIGTGEFGTTSKTKNTRAGYLLAINTNDLKHDITGTYLGNRTNRLSFTEESKIAIHTYDGNSTENEYIYCGFEDMFYINDKQVRYIGLEEGFAWDGTNGTYNKEN